MSEDFLCPIMHRKSQIMKRCMIRILLILIKDVTQIARVARMNTRQLSFAEENEDRCDEEYEVEDNPYEQ